MMTIASVGVDHYRIPLPVVLSDSTHGDIAEFELVTVRVRDAAGTEGLGYTYTVGRGGAAVAALIERDLCPVLLDAEADRIEALWQRMWWAIHYGGRGAVPRETEISPRFEPLDVTDEERWAAVVPVLPV